MIWKWSGRSADPNLHSLIRIVDQNTVLRADRDEDICIAHLKKAGFIPQKSTFDLRVYLSSVIQQEKAIFMRFGGMA